MSHPSAPFAPGPGRRPGRASSEVGAAAAGPAPVCSAAQDLDEPAEHDDERTFEWSQTDDEAVVADVLQALCARVHGLDDAAAPRS